jgi:hypothetical protein
MVIQGLRLAVLNRSQHRKTQRNCRIDFIGSPLFTQPDTSRRFDTHGIQTMLLKIRRVVEPQIAIDESGIEILGGLG